VVSIAKGDSWPTGSSRDCMLSGAGALGEKGFMGSRQKWRWNVWASVLASSGEVNEPDRMDRQLLEAKNSPDSGGVIVACTQLREQQGGPLRECDAGRYGGRLFAYRGIGNIAHNLLEEVGQTLYDGCCNGEAFIVFQAARPLEERS
ncbi:hypothetical protein BaRGS_00017533, partial [Batillaria attramentaria]